MSAGKVLANGKARVGLAIFCVFALAAIFGPWFTRAVLGHTAVEPNYLAVNEPPSGDYLLGTTATGQDVFAQVIVGSRASLLVGLLAAIISTAIAIAVGIAAGFLGKYVDAVLNFVTNLFIVIPAFPLMLVVAGYLQNTGPVVIALVIGLFGWTGGARALRAQTMSLRSRDYIVAMGMVGEGRGRLLALNVLPQLSGWVSAMFLHGIIGGILAEAGLAFLGISGAETVSWGTMIEHAQQQNALLNGEWWWFVPPGLCIAAIGTAAGLVNFGIDEAANPQLRSGTRSRMTRRLARRMAPART